MLSPKTTSILSRLPAFYRSEEHESVLYRLLETYALLLEGAEQDLIRVMRSHWVDKADNEGSDGLDAQQKGDLDKLFALWLESLGGTALLRQTGRRSGAEGEADDRAYRDRIKALIDVIRRGASTVEGIRAVVAANLGIIGDNPVAIYARNQIRIVEYLPESVKTELPSVALYSPFNLENPNPVHIPVGFFIQVSGQVPLPLVELFVELPATQQRLICPLNLVSGDELYLFFDKTGLLNGEAFQAAGTGIQLPPGISQVQIGAKLGYPGGAFDRTRYELATFDASKAADMGRFDAVGFDESTFALQDSVLSVTALRYNIYPGAFTVTIPWDSPAFTSAFSLSGSAQKLLEQAGLTVPEDFTEKTYETIADLLAEPWMEPLSGTPNQDALLQLFAPMLLPREDRFQHIPVNPRAQIRSIIERVRAAGIYTLVQYEKRFTETNALSDALQLSGVHSSFQETSILDHAKHDQLKLLTLQKPAPEKHELDDALTISGVFGVTGFDTLNTFA